MRVFTAIRTVAFTLLLVLMVLRAAGQSDIVKAGTYAGHLKSGSETLLTGSTTFFEKYNVIAVTLKPKELYQPKIADPSVDELLILLKGNLNVTFGGKSNRLEPGSISFMIPGEKHSYRNDDSTPVIFYLFQSRSKLAMDADRGKSNGGSFLVHWNDAAEKKHERGSRRDFFNRPTASCSKYEMHVTSLNHGLNSHLPHTHAEEEIILMIKGNGVVRMDSTQLYPASAGELVFIPSGILHGLENVTKEGSCEYYAFQWKREN